MRKHALVIHNPVAGKHDPEQFQDDVTSLLSKYNFDTTFIQTKLENDYLSWKETVNKIQPDSIVVAGGDGTIMEVVTALYGEIREVELVVVPIGTANVFARTILLPINPLVALEDCLKGSAKKFDVGCITNDNSYFMLTADIGLGADMIEKTSRKLKNNFGFFAYVMSGIRSLLTRREYVYNLVIDSKKMEIKADSIFVMNAAQIGVRKPFLSPGINPHDGSFDVFILYKTNPLYLIYFLVKILFGKLHHVKQEHIRAKTVSFDVPKDSDLVIQIDGDTREDLQRVDIEIVPDTLSIMVPTYYK